MAEIITTLHPDGDENTNLYPNIKKQNIPSKSISTDKLDDNVLSLIGSLKPSGTDTSTNILAFTSDKGIYVATDNGHWYYWNGSAYADGGVYQSSEDIEQIKDDVKQIEEELSLIATIEENLFNKDSEDIITNKYVNGNGDLLDNTYYFVSNYIEVSNGDVVNANLSSDYYGGCLYDRNKTALGRIQFVNNTYTINNTNAAYIRLNGFIANIDTAMVSINRPLPESYIPFGITIIPADNFLKVINPLYGKKAIFNGDSICYGAGFLGGYASMIANNNNMTVTNYAVSGATITAETQTTTYWLCRNISSMSNDADYIILEGGVNDPNSDNMGTITSGFNEPLDDTTFCGAFESMLKQSILKWKGKKIGFILSPKAYSYDGSGADKNKWDNARAICEKWSVPYLDLRNMSGLTAGLSEINQMFFKNGDGVHPNEAGYKVIVPKIEAWMKTL